MLEVHQFPCLDDNYGFLLHDTDSGETTCIDTPDADACLCEAAAKGWRITQIWNTHWHPDHAGGNETIKGETGCLITAPERDAARIPDADRTVQGGDSIWLGDWEAKVIDVGGHTLGHVAYYLPRAGIAFVGDSLFPLGCGRMFEGTAPQFWASLSRLKALPPETMLYSAHEYTASNAKFALHADPDNAALKIYAEDVAQRRAAGKPTVPVSLEQELAANPFLRADDAGMQARWAANGAKVGDAVTTFAALREAKNTF